MPSLRSTECFSSVRPASSESIPAVDAASPLTGKGYLHYMVVRLETSLGATLHAELLSSGAASLTTFERRSRRVPAYPRSTAFKSRLVARIDPDTLNFCEVLFVDYNRRFLAASRS